MLFPVWGILLFIVLYLLAAILFPGGSDFNKTATGFSWKHNYWCELLAKESPNAMPNLARPVAIIAMVVLAISLIIFWFNIPGLFTSGRIGSAVIRYCGISSTLVLPVMLTGFHDMVINLAALLGCIAIVILIVNLYRHKMHLLFYFGILCLLLCGVNNYIYYTTHLLHYLPVIQKISFLIFLLWFTLLTANLYRKVK